MTQRRAGTIDRRGFLSSMAALFTCANAGPVLAGALGADEIPGGSEFWPTVNAVQTHLFPSGPDSPGAGELNAEAYLKAVLVDPQVDGQERAFITDGVGLLNEFTRKQKGVSFAELNGDQREEILRRIEGSPVGRYWISLIIYYIFEALLTDPVYGGNPDGVGWRWLEHKPGFPQPPAGRRYQELG
jgi:gluconate 2-dehydrogenase gamma chain